MFTINMQRRPNLKSVLVILIGLWAVVLTVDEKNGQSLKDFDAFARTEAETFSSSSGVFVEVCTDTPGASQVDYIQDGDWILFNGMDFQDGAYGVDLRVGTRYDFTSLGHIILRLDSLDATPFATFLTRNTTEYTWVTLSQLIAEVPVGVHDLYFTFASDDPDAFIADFNWFQFQKD